MSAKIVFDNEVLSPVELARLKAGDEASWHHAYNTHYKKLFAVCIRLLGSQDSECEDIVQETFAKAHKAIDRYTPDAPFYVWLRRICINRCYDRLKIRQRSISVEDATLEGVSLKQNLQEMLASSSSAEMAETLALLRQTFGKLEKACQIILGLRYYEEKDYAQIGLAMKLPIGTVMSRLSRCKARLKIRMLSCMKETPRA